MIYAQFKPFYAPYWGASVSTYYKVSKFSNSRLSAYLERDGSIVLVPVGVIEFSYLREV
jgi:hypothetical protein